MSELASEHVDLGIEPGPGGIWVGKAQAKALKAARKRLTKDQKAEINATMFRER